MKPPLPFLISIPHGGTQMPPELANRLIITSHDLFDDSDSFTQEIYDVADLVIHVATFKIARAFVDVSRAPHQMPPDFPDGLIKSSTCLLKPIYADGQQPDIELRTKLINNYYQPYHNELEKWSRDPRITLAFDCHSMLSIAPDISPDKGQKRPLFNLGNLDGRACPDEILKLLADSFVAVFDLTPTDVTINRPFKGGFITQKFANNPVPWIQIEMNRILYLYEKYFDRPQLKINRQRLTELNALFVNVLVDFHTKLIHIHPDFAR